MEDASSLHPLSDNSSKKLPSLGKRAQLLEVIAMVLGLLYTTKKASSKIV